MSSKFNRSYSSNIDIASRQSNAVVFEFGTAYIRIGIAGESKPRRIFPLSSPLHSISPLSEQSCTQTTSSTSSTAADGPSYWSSCCNFPQDLFVVKSCPGYEDLGPWLRNLYTYHLLLKPRSRRVVVVLPIYHHPPGLKSALEAIFLTQLQVPSILFTHPFETIPYAIGETNAGIIVDIGKEEGRIVCFFNGNMCENTLQIVPIGYQVVVKQIRRDCCKHPDKLVANATRYGTKQVLEDVFFDLDNPNSLMYAFLSCLVECPLDLRKQVVQHIVFVGGGVEGIPHLEQRFLKSIQSLFVERKKVECITANKTIKETTIYGIQNEKHERFDKLATLIMTAPLSIMYPLHFRPSCMAWIGASIMGSMQLSNDNQKWIHRSQSVLLESKTKSII
mmetsp:Transcript_16821/g.31863  ORF Transcript_16821/g.31863 Transcript_16821/m.31863 type:complete len:391 (+) Transcript_16821:185-1357(+)